MNTYSKYYLQYFTVHHTLYVEISFSFAGFVIFSAHDFLSLFYHCRLPICATPLLSFILTILLSHHHMGLTAQENEN